MSDSRAHESGNLDFGGREEEEEEEERYSVGKGGETMLTSSSIKRIKEISIDRLSALPDSLIFQILHYFDAEEAAVIIVLSKRWQSLWSELPRLKFQNHSRDAEKMRDFVCWVHRTLLLRSGACLEEFKVDFLYDECYAPDVNSWVRFAVKSKVKELCLELHSSRHFHTLPQLMYSSSSLEHLRIKRCIVAPQRTIEWQSLTHLDINDVELHEHVIQKILSGCPLLYMLVLSSCWGFERLDVDAKNLYGLMLSDTDDKNSAPLIEISAPYLCSLSVFFCLMKKKLQLTNISSLVSAEINFSVFDNSPEVMNHMMELLQKTQHADGLILGGACIEVLSEMVLRGWRLQQSRREYLVLDTWIDQNSIPGILGLLESSPNIESLVIECLDSYEISSRTWVPAARDDLDLNLSHLKTIRFFEYADPNLGGEPMLTMARILLKRATTLEKMVIDAEECSTNFASEFTKMTQTVHSYPRSSEKAVIVFLHQ